MILTHWLALLLGLFAVTLYGMLFYWVYITAIRSNQDSQDKALEDFEEKLMQVGTFMEKGYDDPAKPKLKLVVNNKQNKR